MHGNCKASSTAHGLLKIHIDCLVFTGTPGRRTTPFLNLPDSYHIASVFLDLLLLAHLLYFYRVIKCFKIFLVL
jgi:hypothetical protein